MWQFALQYKWYHISFEGIKKECQGAGEKMIAHVLEEMLALSSFG